MAVRSVSAVGVPIPIRMLLGTRRPLSCNSVLAKIGIFAV